MNRLNCFFILTLFIGLTAFKYSSESINYVVRADKSKIKWSGAKIGGGHKGEILFSSGTLVFEGDQLVGGNMDVDMSSMTCTDLTDVEQQNKLLGHLKSDDFFGVANHPTASIKIKKAYSYGSFQPKTEGRVGNRFKIVADLTIKGITKEIKFEAKDYRKEGDTSKGYLAADVIIDRTDFDVRYGSGNFFDNLGDKVIYDEFQLRITVQYKVEA